MLKFFEKWWVKENPYLKSFYNKGETSMAKFKVGDKVRVKEDLLGDKYYPRPDGSELRFAPDMTKYRGQVYTIASVDDSGDYTLEGVFDSSSYFKQGWYFCDSMLEPVSVGFTKADLKTGMVVECRDGSRRLVVGEKFMGQASWTEFGNYTDDLKNRIKSDFDINMVYESNGNKFNTVFEDRYLTIIWKREEEPEHKEMTVEEIEKELGYKIKVVADKK